MVYEPRTYRRTVGPGELVTFEVTVGETDLQVSALRDLSERTRAVVVGLRRDLESYIALHPRFAESFVPVDADETAPEIVRAMARAGAGAGVGPMAAVAGAFAERVARALSADSAEVIVENGGDLFVMGRRERLVLLVAGDSPLSGKLAVALPAGDLPAAVCTSSGTVGHSVSLGVAHAATVVADDGALADAVATATGNRVHGPEDIEPALAFARGIDGVRGAAIIAADRVGAVGLRLERIGNERAVRD